MHTALFLEFPEEKNAKKKIESNNFVVESKKTFNFLEEHPSHKYMVMCGKGRLIIPGITSINLLPNTAGLNQNSDTCNFDTKNAS